MYKLVLIAALALLATPALAAPKVQLALYYESLCPYCQQFIQTSLNDAWTAEGVKDIFEIAFIPYGNAHETTTGGGTYDWTCQHGPNECAGNLLESCVLGLNPNQTVYYPVIHCLEGKNDPGSAGQECCEKFGVDYNAVKTCVDGSQGNHLQHVNAQKTDALNPPHQYVPWITAGGKHTEAIQNAVQDDALKYICENYTGVKPAGCPKTTIKGCMRN